MSYQLEESPNISGAIVSLQQRFQDDHYCGRHAIMRYIDVCFFSGLLKACQCVHG